MRIKPANAIFIGAFAVNSQMWKSAGFFNIIRRAGFPHPLPGEYTFCCAKPSGGLVAQGFCGGYVRPFGGGFPQVPKKLSVLDIAAQILNGRPHILALFHLLINPLDGVHYGGVMLAVHKLADFRQAEACKLAH